METIRTLPAHLADRELEIANGRRGAMIQSAFQAFHLTATGLVCMLVLVMFLQWAVGREIARRKQVADTLDKAHVRGRIEVGLVRRETGTLSLSCLDDGVGIAEDFDWRNTPSAGLKIVQILAKQLHGELKDRSSLGTRFELTFADSDA
jgi:hypothetical protein